MGPENIQIFKKGVGKQEKKWENAFKTIIKIIIKYFNKASAKYDKKFKR